MSLDKLLNTGQVESLAALQRKAVEFESLLGEHGIEIPDGCELRGVLNSIVNVLGKHLKPELRDSREDIRKAFADVLGFWTFLTKVIRLKDHADFVKLLPHLRLLTQGSIVHTKQSRVSDTASNKIFELLIALMLMDVGSDMSLDDPDKAKGNNPDILITIGGMRWGFACKAVTGSSGITFFDNLKKGIDQIEKSEAQIGCCVIAFRNLLRHSDYWPLMNEEGYNLGEEPIFGTHDPMQVGHNLAQQVLRKQRQVTEEIGVEPVLKKFANKKALPGFLALCQTATGTSSSDGPVPTSVTILCLANFHPSDAYLSVFEELNRALHERKHVENENREHEQ